MNPLFERAYTYTRNTLEKNRVNLRPYSKTKSRIVYDRYRHIERVTLWTERIVTGISEPVDRESLILASILHDVGYGAVDISEDHAEAGAQLAELFLQQEKLPEEQIQKIVDLVRRHPEKRLMFEEDTPLELVILMEADLMDDIGAQGIVMDAWINTAVNLEKTSFDTIYEHILKYNAEQMKEEPMRTEPARRFWKEKQELTKEFVRQLARDLGKE